MNSICQHTQ